MQVWDKRRDERCTTVVYISINNCDLSKIKEGFQSLIADSRQWGGGGGTAQIKHRSVKPL